jgi:hypothetical protein
MTDIKQTIDKGINQCSIIKDTLNSLKEISNVDDAILEIKNQLSHSMYNPALLIEFAQRLQISDNPKLHSTQHHKRPLLPGRYV